MTHPSTGPTTQLSIVDSLAGQSADGSLVFLDDDLSPTELPFGELRDRAERVAGVLHGRHGIGPDTRVCLLGRTSLDLLVTMFGIWRAGATVTVMPVPRGTGPADLPELVARRVAAAHAGLVVADPATVAALSEASPPVPVADFPSLASGPAGTPPPGPGPDDVAVLQFTSGTTAVPRAVAVTHGQIVANSRDLFAVGDLRRGDGFVTWLPLYHDMGIITLTGAVAHGLTPYVMATQTFSGWPGAWLEAISTFRVASTIAPNSAYALVSHYLSLGRGRYDLSALRVAWNGAEPIDPVPLEQFTTYATKQGMPATAVSPAYGLAEATLVVTADGHDEFYRTVTVDRQALEDGHVRLVAEGEPGRALVDCGAPIAGTTVVVTDDAGNPLPDGRVGSVRVHGPGVVPQYWTPDGSPHPTALLDDAGRLVTGDLGFQHEGRLYVCGRQKDMIIVAGRNLYPEDFEFLTDRMPGIRQGNVMAFSLPDTEEMVVVAETKLRDDDARQLARTVRDAIAAELSYTPHEVVLVSPGTLPKTTSGKRQRHACRELYRDNALAVRASSLT